MAKLPFPQCGMIGRHKSTFTIMYIDLCSHQTALIANTQQIAHILALTILSLFIAAPKNLRTVKEKRVVRDKQAHTAKIRSLWQRTLSNRPIHCLYAAAEVASVALALEAQFKHYRNRLPPAKLTAHQSTNARIKIISTLLHNIVESLPPHATLIFAKAFAHVFYSTYIVHSNPDLRPRPLSRIANAHSFFSANSLNTNNALCAIHANATILSVTQCLYYIADFRCIWRSTTPTPPPPPRVLATTTAPPAPAPPPPPRVPATTTAPPPPPPARVPAHVDTLDPTVLHINPADTPANRLAQFPYSSPSLFAPSTCHLDPFLWAFIHYKDTISPEFTGSLFVLYLYSVTLSTISSTARHNRLSVQRKLIFLLNPTMPKAGSTYSRVLDAIRSILVDNAYIDTHKVIPLPQQAISTFNANYTVALSVIHDIASLKSTFILPFKQGMLSTFLRTAPLFCPPPLHANAPNILSVAVPILHHILSRSYRWRDHAIHL